MNLVNVLTTSFTAFIMSFISAHNATSIAGIYFALALLCGLTYCLFVRHTNNIKQ